MKIELPHVGESVTEGTIQKWLKAVGDQVSKYEPLVEVVTDKVSMEVPAPADGTITGLLVEEGQTVPMGSVIAEMEAEEQNVSSTSNTENNFSDVLNPGRTGRLLKDVTPVGPTGSAGPQNKVREIPSTSRSSRPRYSPAVARIAEEQNIDLKLVTGTGIKGRVTRKDVRDYITTIDDDRKGERSNIGGDLLGDLEDEKIVVTPIRRMIAERMVQSSRMIPEAWSLTEVDVTGLVQLRESVKDGFLSKNGINLTYLPFVVRAVAESLRANPLLNSSWEGEFISLKKHINIGIAVASDNGLVVPVIHDADCLGLTEIAVKISELASDARKNALSLESVQGGTFTLNNTGALGSVASQPIINFPQSAILTTEAISKKAVVLETDSIAIRSIMNICLTFDHRVMDGSEAASFSQLVKRLLEDIGPHDSI